MWIVHYYKLEGWAPEIKSNSFIETTVAFVEKVSHKEHCSLVKVSELYLTDNCWYDGLELGSNDPDAHRLANRVSKSSVNLHSSDAYPLPSWQEYTNLVA